MTKAKIVILIFAVVFSLSSVDLTSASQSAAKKNQTSYFIVGAVNNPGVYQIEGSASVLKLITLAGGPSVAHSDTAFLIRKTQSVGGTDAVALSPEYQVIPIDLSGLLNGQSEKDVALTAGDILNIPHTEVFFVKNNTIGIRSFPITSGLTLTRAVLRAVSSNLSSQIHEVIVLRNSHGTGKPQEIRINLDDINAGKATDILVESGDVIVLP